MSHRRSVIEPAAGLTLLTGPNNCGKSAIVLALQALCYNERGIGKHLVRHGEKNARVMVETDDGHRIEWVSENGAVRYVVDGVRTDRSVTPDDLDSKLRLPEVAGDDGKTFDIHFAEQKDPIFLLNGGSRAAAFFAASSDAGYLVKMQQLLRQRKSDQTRDARTLKIQSEEVEKELVAFEPLPEIEQLLHDAVKAHDATDAALKDAQERGRFLAILGDLTEQATLMAREQSVLDALTPPPNLIDTAPLNRIQSDLQTAGQRADAALTTRNALAELHAPPVLDETAPLERLLSQFDLWTLKAARMRAFTNVVREMAEPPAPLADDGLRFLTAQISTIEATLLTGHQDVRQLAQNMNAVQEELRTYAEVHPICPTCGGRIDADTLLLGGHTHAAV